MGSPEKPNKSTNPFIASTTSPQSNAFQDSPIFNYINNLSPIKPVKGTSVIHGFPGLSSPPLVFTSPRINTHRQSIDLKRSQCHVSSHSESYQQADLDKHITTGAVVPERPIPHMSSELNPHKKQEHGNNQSRHDKTGSPSRCVDDYLADLSAMVELTPSANLSLKQSEDGPSKVADSVNPDGSMERHDEKDYEGNIVVEMGAAPTFVEQVKEDHEGNLSSDPKPVENDGMVQSNICQKVPSNISVQQYDQRVAQVNQSQLGKRRRLQFEETQERTTENDPGSPNQSNVIANSEVQDSSCGNIPSTPSNIQPTGGSSSSQNTRNASLTVSKPSGIGLHLNSIVNARPLALIPNVSLNSTDRSYLDAETPKSVKIIERQEKFDPGILNSEQTGKVGEFVRTNPKKKRKKTESTGDGCKRCNCKKTKCLKLYCDCFAAGIYCADSCSCQGCFNRPECEDTVLETRKQIESRNPLAFAPKIVQRLTQPTRSQSGEDGDQLTPITGKHKRGCNCKKSMCLKKYCECYQANVGCSDGCRCEDCQNIYGKKEVYGMSREIGSMEAINEKLNDSFDDKLKVGSTIRPRSSLLGIQKPYNLTPETPSFQRSDHGNDASRARFFPVKYLPSPESDCLFYPPYTSTPRSPQDSANYEGNEDLEIAPYNLESYPNVESMDEFSPGCPTTNNNITTSVGFSRSQFLPPPGLSFSSVNSLRFRGSPVTPVTLFGPTKPTDSKQKRAEIIDDDTPKILKDSSIQLNKVKVASPNKKRISPPKIRLHELGSNSLKSGRKFILKAVPSFPPLTPCIDSKDSCGQNSKDPPGDNNAR